MHSPDSKPSNALLERSNFGEPKTKGAMYISRHFGLYPLQHAQLLLIGSLFV